jgi:hypothetical protein
MLAALFLLVAAAASAPGQIDWNHPDDNPVTVRDSGFCAGIGWVTLLPGEVATVDYGPDFNVYRVRGPGGREWGIYTGFAGQSGPDSLLLSKDGARVYRGTEKDEGGKPVFDGYFTSRHHFQGHFFGNVFKDAPADRAFFSRIRLGRKGEQLCAQDHPR